MDITSFLANVAISFREKYLNLAQEFNLVRPPIIQRPTDPVDEIEPAEKSTQPVDSFEPSGEPLPVTTVTTESDPTTETGTTSATGDDPAVVPPENPVEQKPDGTYYYQRQARLDYELNLRFDLSAISQTIERLADGETEAVEQFAAAGFGLQAGFDIKGIQKIKTNMPDAVDGSRRHELTQTRARQTGKFLAQSRDFAVKAFYDQATRIHSSLNESARGAHRLTVNRFAARYRLDSQFSFASLTRFNVQTKQLSEQMPDAVAGYVNSAGNIAAGSSTDMMATFFDAVDSYLDGTEQAIFDQVTAFFDQAAEELGFSGAMVDEARDHLTSSIESFFDRVDVALAQIESKFVPETPVPVIEPEPIEPLIPDEVVPLEPKDETRLVDNQALATG